MSSYLLRKITQFGGNNYLLIQKLSTLQSDTQTVVFVGQKKIILRFDLKKIHRILVGKLIETKAVIKTNLAIVCNAHCAFVM